MLANSGYSDIEIKDFMNDDSVRKEVVAIQAQFSVPLSMQGHLLVLVDNKYLFEGRVPIELIMNYLKNPSGQIVVTQDNMDDPTAYQILMKGKVVSCPIDKLLSQCLSENSFDVGDSSSMLTTTLSFGLLLTAIGAVIYSMHGN